MKSALELAMERADAVLGGEKIELTPEQVKEIDEIKKVYEAKWAEQEITFKEKMRKLDQETDLQRAVEQRNQLQEDMQRAREQIFAEREAKIEEARKEKTG
jgi:hypothetical protein